MPPKKRRSSGVKGTPKGKAAKDESAPPPTRDEAVEAGHNKPIVEQVKALTNVIASQEAAPQSTSPRNKSHSKPIVEQVKSLKQKLAMKSPESLFPTDGSFSSDVVQDIFETVMEKGQNTSGINKLEASAYLESYLLPHFPSEAAPFSHIFSMVLMMNEKFREGVPVWEAFKEHKETFSHFVLQLFKVLEESEKLNWSQRASLTLFLTNCFQSLEQDMVRNCFLRVVSLALWKNLSSGRRRDELRDYPTLRRHWQQLLERERETAEEKPTAKKRKGNNEASTAEKKKESDGIDAYTSTLIPSLIKHFVRTVKQISGDLSTPLDPDMVRYIERFLELSIDLVSQLPTRRFLRALLDDMHVVVHCRLSEMGKRPEGKLFRDLVEMLKFYQDFEINDQTGQPLTPNEVKARHYNRIMALQGLVFKQISASGESGELKDFVMKSAGSVSSRESLRSYFQQLGQVELRVLCEKLHLIESQPDHEEPVQEDGEKINYSKEFLLELIVASHEKRISQTEAINRLPLFPSEDFLWDEKLSSLSQYDGQSVLALPKLNLQFLTFYDYLLRSFNLYRLESAYEIKEDIMDAVRRLSANRDLDGRTVFRGWARMACPLSSFSIIEVAKPRIGESKPSSVKAEIKYSLAHYGADLIRDWDEFREHDVIFLLTIKPPSTPPKPDDRSGDDHLFPEEYGVISVRGAEVYELRDEAGNVMNDPSGREDREGDMDREKLRKRGTARTVRVRLDAAQYQKDLEDGSDVYDGLNIIIRRKKKENNFKGVLETIRDLMNVTAVDKAVPVWLHDVFLGYGDPSAASYQNLPTRAAAVDFRNTFIDAKHLRASFPSLAIEFLDPKTERPLLEDPLPPYRLEFRRPRGNEQELLRVFPYSRLNMGPYQIHKEDRLKVRFTPAQVEAIRSGLSPGLTTVVGPPGTGKTDVAVQIIANLYHNYPSQRTLIVTHSNQALNDLFDKIVQMDIEQRHLLRLGSGQKDLGSAGDFSKWGRVQYTLARRLELLEQVGHLAGSLGITGDVGYTCETAGYFHLYHIVSRIEEFELKVKGLANNPNWVRENFPFAAYFQTESPIFVGDFEKDLEAAKGCFRYLDSLFKELEDYRAFEVLRTHTQRGDYLLTKQARIVALTCTHAALIRSKLVALGFKYDNIVMEEAAQVLEIETFIPLVLQEIEGVGQGAGGGGAGGTGRLKRVVLIGDHHQLPPVVKNEAFRKYGHLDQSLFSRFIRLGVPAIQLDAQGRARPSLSRLYNWRYKNLSDLPNVLQETVYKKANAGFAYDFQFINVEDFEGKGEFTPSPYFYQNLGEAEYVVAVYQLMRLMGYPKEKIAILSTYNGQKHLIRDVLNRRCAPFPMFGLPSKVTTVDRYQGQQNDYILLSLVRTRSVGHLRDVRRLIVAMSRARLGLYIFGRLNLFARCQELTPAFKVLTSRPTKLQLVLGENHPTERDAHQVPPSLYEVENVTQAGILVHQMAQARQ